MAESIVIALIGLGSGGLATILLKVLEHFLGKSKEKAEQDSGIRGELREDLDRKNAEILELKREVDALELEVDSWRAKYYTVLESKFSMIEDLPSSVEGL